MSDPATANNATATTETETAPTAATEPATEAATATKPAEPKPSFVKLAMRNMVRKGGQSLFHFSLTTIGLLGLLVGLSYLTR